ncbi:MAG: 16S rRNA processing protein RimM [Candidatus Solibacter sp.]|nr:16S rRNA processing protein RimM [Candidatus Solibacter sp.]
MPEPILDDWVVIGRLGRARGLRGELLGRANHTADSYRWVKRVALRLPGGSLAGAGQWFEVESIRDYKDGLVYKFREIGARTDAEAVEHAELLVRESDRPALGSGEFYLSDLLGCRVEIQATGELVGVVSSWQEFGAQTVLEVKPASGDLIWIPLVREICVEIDTAARRIAIDPPDGLLDLNQEASVA